ncbi:hypothetical protein E8E13_011340 [Curvularia kusanoi]|uniref:Protein kinase domain-containing protein n=1 Tax=Curvularia kusanoi TaxID=90978 RepID=A0A9P4TLS0_CURKU|nr:hypothetical protein E8E13_011340 [Curvularia kusanoi]
MSTPRMPSGYVPVVQAGKGHNAAVHFCLPPSKVDKFLKANNGNPLLNHGIDDLRRSLVAVKVALHHDSEQDDYNEPRPLKINNDKNEHIKTEDAALRAVKECEAEHANEMRAYFPDIQDTELQTYEDDVPCVVLEAITPSVTLYDMLDFSENGNIVKLPTILTYHLFLSLTSAVKFLHNEVKWTHSDITSRNVILRPTRNSSDLPQVVLIDFGLARSFDDSPDSVDHWGIAHLIQEMVSKAAKDKSPEWKIFCDLTEKKEYKQSPVTDKKFQEIWGELTNTASKQTATASPSQKERVHKVYWEVVQKGKKFKGDEEDVLVEAVRTYKGL